MTDATAIADELAIRNLTAAYTDAVNRFDLDDIAQVYDEDAEFTMMERPTVFGRDGIIEILRQTFDRYEYVLQLLHSGVVQLDGDRARARWQITELQILLDGSRRFITGRYEDEYARGGDRWWFTRRTFTARYLGDMAFTDPSVPDRPVLFGLWD